MKLVLIILSSGADDLFDLFSTDFGIYYSNNKVKSVIIATNNGDEF